MKGRKTPVTKLCHICFSIEKIYKSDMVYDVVDMHACHLFFGRLWQFNADVVNRRKNNMYEFRQNRQKFCLVHITNKKNNSKAKWTNFLAIVKSHLEDDCDSWKKLEKEKKIMCKIYLEVMQPLLVEFADITPLEMADGFNH